MNSYKKLTYTHRYAMLKITQLLELLFIKHRALTIAIIASVLIHLLIAYEASFKIPNQDNALQVIDVHLSTAQAMQKSTSAPVVTTLQPSHPEPTSHINQLSNIADNENMQETSVGTSTIPSADLTIATNEIIKSSEVASITINALPQPYHHVVTDFDVYQDSQTNVTGTVRVVFNISENSTYSLTSIAEASGLTSLFSNALAQKSDGVILETGLRPNYYTYQFGSEDKNIQSANFAWSDGIIEMNSEQGKKTEALVAGAQDSLSYMYQFMFVPPLENTEISMSDGKNSGTYSYIFLGNEKTVSALGELNTIHLTRGGDEDGEKTELWLAIDYQYLPVKIRKTKKNGNYIEQIAIRISTSTP